MVLSYLIILSPLLGFLLNLLLGIFRQKKLSAIIGVSAVFFPFILSLSLFFWYDWQEYTLSEFWFTWLQTEAWQIDLAFKFDSLSLLMSLIILGIGSLIHLYSVGYMWQEEGFARFFAYLNLFVFFMLFLVLSDNLLGVFLGWEGVGLCSYLLIGFDYHREKAASAAKKAFVMNRIGDLGFLLATFLLLTHFGTLEFVRLNAELPAAVASGGISASFVSLVCLLFFFAACGKSAQFPLFTWLPDAMEGPTPVSALIHAATMVTAGIYLIVRLWPVFELSSIAQSVILYTGGFTALISALIATKQWDIKKVLAYSTISQLGYMFMALGVGAYSASMFHLTTHAFFKALLFLGAGTVILQLHHQQDLRLMGGLKKKMFSTFLVLSIGLWCIAGLPFGAGFFSKDDILWQVYSNNGWLIVAVGVLVAYLTAYYSYRLGYLVFYQKDPATSDTKPPTIKAEPLTMKYVLFLLAVGSVAVGFLGVPHYLDFFHSGHIFSKYLASTIRVGSSFDVTGADLMREIFLMLASVAAALSGWWVARRRFKVGIPQVADSHWHRLLAGKFFLDEIYHSYLVLPLAKLSRLVGNDYLESLFYQAPKLVRRVLLKLGELVGRPWQTGNLQDYGLAVALSLVLFIAYFVVRSLI